MALLDCKLEQPQPIKPGTSMFQYSMRLERLAFVLSRELITGCAAWFAPLLFK